MTKKIIWKVDNEALDENGNATIWVLDISGTESQDRLKSKYVWITLTPYGNYNVEVALGNVNNTEFKTLTTCKTLTSAKRWVSQYLL